ncbi:TetR/AcrR family transcriptional regulator [Brevibacterium salitolerans]
MNRPVLRTHAQARAEMREGILRVGNALLAEHGAAGLSVRAIARELGVASSALYRHVASRDELLTLLLVDAYSELAARVEEALEGGASGERGGEPDEREGEPLERGGEPASAAEALAVLARAMRGWAVANPAKWALVYGSPVPGYAAPAERTTGPGTAVLGRFMGMLAADAEEGPVADSGLSEGLDAVLTAGGEELGLRMPAQRAAQAVEAWTGLVGLISAEVFQQLGPDFAGHGAEMLERWIAGTVSRFALC